MLPVSETHQPTTTQELTACIKQCAASSQPMYLTGGCTSLDYGRQAKTPGVEISFAGLDKIVDHAAGDMTVTVQAGVRLETLNQQLATAGQRLPFYVPDASRATIGGIVATGWNGPLRFGLGGVRDYVIGISAVDGAGNLFKAGGRVVKNVAGYDFCKLLTGSLGSLAAIEQLTFKLCPVPPQTAYVMLAVEDLNLAGQLAQQLVDSPVTPVAIELLSGPYWHSHPAIDGPSPPAHGALLIAGLEGTAAEVEWMTQQLTVDWQPQGELEVATNEEPTSAITRELADFAGGESPLTIRASLRPSGVTAFIAAARQLDAECSIQSHAADGVVNVRFSEYPPDGLSRSLIGVLQPLAASYDGSATVVRNPAGSEMTLQSVWAGGSSARNVMQLIKAEFDPQNLLNPGRFVFD